MPFTEVTIGGARLIRGDCVSVMPTIGPVDAIVTDPPYGLEFMGREWDGANGFRRALNEADAGRDSVFGRMSQHGPEYRTGAKWQSGGGFSKPGIGERKTEWPSFSAISRFGAANPTCGTCGGRLRGKKRCTCEAPDWKPIGKRRNPENEGLPGDMTGGGMGSHMRTYQAWTELWAREAFRVLKPGGYMLVFGGTRTFHRLACAIEDAGFEIRDCIMWLHGQGFPKSLNVSKAIDRKLGAEREVIGTSSGPNNSRYQGARYSEKRQTAFGTVQDQPDLTAPATPEAAQWEGWGTALKPAFEPILVCRKPLDGTVADNVLKHGVGGLNIDACRVGTETFGWDGSARRKAMEGDPRKGAALGMFNPGARGREGEASAQRRYPANGGTNFAATPGPRGGDPAGRWPANVAHDGSDEVMQAFVAFGQRGACAPASGPTLRNGNTSVARGRFNGLPADRDPAFYGDSGSPARFYYAAKANKADRAGSRHPTIKPQALLRWLVALVTPPGGTVLDCFAGSGSTGQAALAIGRRPILIEREAEYFRDIKRRIEAAQAARAA
jgi:site-specific DNA-methyltransferase (adenine-specific)